MHDQNQYIYQNNLHQSHIHQNQNHLHQNHLNQNHQNFNHNLSKSKSIVLFLVLILKIKEVSNIKIIKKDINTTSLVSL